MKSRILFVDAEPHVLEGMKRTLFAKSEEWELCCADDADAALQQLYERAFDVVVTDARLPGKTGFQLLEEILAGEQSRDIPVIILTGEQDHDLKRRALDLGAADLLNKPVCAADLIARIGSALRIKSYRDQIKAQNALLEERLRERTRELMVSRQEILWRLAKAGEYRDEETGNHVVRVARYCQVIGEALGLDREFIEMVTLTSPLHDIGKIGIPDRILRKPGKLDPDEWEIMKQHCAIGARILKEDYAHSTFYAFLSMPNAQPGIRVRNPMLDMAALIALYHHEKWDGSGYPHGFSGELIPLEARIVALADVYDALSSARPYKPAFAENEVLAIMAANVGRHFDPFAYIGLKRSWEALRAIREEHPDDEATSWSKAA